MKTKHYEVEIRRLGYGWGTMPHGKLRKAWETYCRGERFATLAEAVGALGCCLDACEEEEIYAETIKAHPAAEEDAIAYAIYANDERVKRCGDIAETLTYPYDDGECRIVECE